MMTIEEARRLEDIANANNGHCDRCNRIIKIYRYGISKSMAHFMRCMADEVRRSGVNSVDIRSLGLKYSTQTQMTKLRLHGLIARVKDNKGVQVQNHWLITHKGWDFITGKNIAKYVLVFDNQVLGHEDSLINIRSIDGANGDYGEEKISTPEAGFYGKAREGIKSSTIMARYKGRDDTFFHHQTYTLKINKLQVGKPVEILEPVKRMYKDIIAFHRDWAVVNNKEAI